MTIRKVRPKQVWKPPTAADHNAIAAAADMYRRGPDAAPERQQPVATDVIMVRNNSGSDKRRGDVLAVTKTKLLSAIERERPWITASGLNAANRNYILCVLLDPLPAGKIGPAQISGQSVAYVDVHATWHRRAFPSGAAVVQSGLFGPMELLNSPAAPGEQLCHVRIGHADNRIVIAQAAQGLPKARRRRGCLTLGGGTVALCNPTSTPGKYCASSASVTAYNVECEEVEPGTFVTLEPGDDWLPLATPLPCESSSESSSFSSSSSDSSSEPSSSGSSSSGSSSSEESSSEESSSEESSSQPSSSELSSSEQSSSEQSDSEWSDSERSSSQQSDSGQSGSDQSGSEASEGSEGSETSELSEASDASEGSELSQDSEASQGSEPSQGSDDSQGSDVSQGSDECCPCEGDCPYFWAEGPPGHWVLHEPFVTCQSPCHCRPPEGVGGYSGEQRMGTCCGPCEDSSESSDSESSDSEPSGSEPSDSESSGSESSGSGGCLRWTQSGTYNTCEEWGCICPEPERPPAYYGEIILTCCNCTPPYGECDGFDCPYWCMPLDPRCAWRSIPC